MMKCCYHEVVTCPFSRFDLIQVKNQIFLRFLPHGFVDNIQGRQTERIFELYEEGICRTKEAQTTLD